MNPQQPIGMTLHPPDQVTPFFVTLQEKGLRLERGDTSVLQINVGSLCNQACRHCHLRAGPGHDQVMDEPTAKEVIDYARRGRFETVDITGGAPELNPVLPALIRGLTPFTSQTMLRSNLTALRGAGMQPLLDLLTEHRVGVVASLPSLNEAQTDSQRGIGAFSSSLTMLTSLNELGYGAVGSGLLLNLVSNPVGAFLPTSQAEAEDRFRKILGERYEIVFNRLFNLANVPLGRFLDWLVESGNYPGYMKRLISNFNPCALSRVMCRTLVSVSWEGLLYDCDFNLALGLPLAGQRVHVSQMGGPPPKGNPIALGDHCYTCTAGSGFT